MSVSWILTPRVVRRNPYIVTTPALRSDCWGDAGSWSGQVRACVCVRVSVVCMACADAYLDGVQTCCLQACALVCVYVCVCVFVSCAGKYTEAEELLRNCGQPWRAASLRGPTGGWGPVPVGLQAEERDEAYRNNPLQVRVCVCARLRTKTNAQIVCIHARLNDQSPCLSM